MARVGNARTAERILNPSGCQPTFVVEPAVRGEHSLQLRIPGIFPTISRKRPRRNQSSTHAPSTPSSLPRVGEIRRRNQIFHWFSAWPSRGRGKLTRWHLSAPSANTRVGITFREAPITRSEKQGYHLRIWWRGGQITPGKVGDSSETIVEYGSRSSLLKKCTCL